MDQIEILRHIAADKRLLRKLLYSPEVTFQEEKLQEIFNLSSAEKDELIEIFSLIRKLGMMLGGPNVEVSALEKLFAMALARNSKV